MLFAVVLVWFVFAVAGAMLLNASGRATTGFVLGLLLGPVGLIIAAIMRLEQTGAPAAVISAPAHLGERKCPRCAEWVKREAVVCRFCGAALDPLPALTNVQCGDCYTVYTSDSPNCPRCGSTRRRGDNAAKERRRTDRIAMVAALVVGGMLAISLIGALLARVSS